MINILKNYLNKTKFLIRDNITLSKIYYIITYAIKYKKTYYNLEYYVNNDVNHSLSNKFIKKTFAPILNNYIDKIYKNKFKDFTKIRYKKIKKFQKNKLRDFQAKAVSVLDIGCGNNRLYKYLKNDKAELIGIDPVYQISKSCTSNNKFFRCDISDISGKFDIIIFYGSFKIIFKQYKFKIFDILKNLSNKDTLVVCFNNKYVDLTNYEKIRIIKDPILNSNKFEVFKML